MANLKIPMEGKIEIELSEETENVMQRFISAVELLQGTTIDVTRPNVRMVGIDAFGRPQFEKEEEGEDEKNSKNYDPLGRSVDVMLFVADFAVVAGCFLAVAQAIGL